MYSTCSHTSPWPKITSPRRYLAIFLERPAESRNACALNARWRLIGMTTSGSLSLSATMCNLEQRGRHVTATLATPMSDRALLKRLVVQIERDLVDRAHRRTLLAAAEAA